MPVSAEELIEMKQRRRRLQGQVYKWLKNKEPDTDMIQRSQQEVWDLEDEIAFIEKHGFSSYEL